MVLLAGEPPRIDHEYPVMEPLDAAPEPAKVTAWPAGTDTSLAGLVMMPVGGVSVGAVET